MTRPEAEPDEGRTSDATARSEASEPSGRSWHSGRSGHSDHAGQGRREAVEVIEVVLLSVVTILTAWAGYAAAEWSTTSRLDLAHASTLRVESNRALGVADATRNFDSTTFNTWFIAYTLGNKEKMAIAERRFRPAFHRAFVAWMATDPGRNPHAPPGPTYMPQYRQPEQAQATALSQQADGLSAAGDHAGRVADNYVRISLVLASVLFLVGVGSTFKIKTLRWLLTGFGTLVFLGAAVLVATQPLP